jgi:membrane protein DedA with SNARE-associated domain
MADPLAALFRALVAYSYLAGPAFGLLAFLESLVIIGMFIPATPVLFLFGTLIGSGRLDPLAVLPWAFAGAIAGYWLSWWLGHHPDCRCYISRRARSHRRQMARTRVFLRRWGGPSLVLGRYLLGQFQAFIPVVAGVLGMQRRRFHLWNCVSGTTWVLVVVTPGYLAGRGLLIRYADRFDPSTIGLAVLLISLVATLVAVTAFAWRTARRPATG